MFVIDITNYIYIMRAECAILRLCECNGFAGGAHTESLLC